MFYLAYYLPVDVWILPASLDERLRQQLSVRRFILRLMCLNSYSTQSGGLP